MAYGKFTSFNDAINWSNSHIKIIDNNVSFSFPEVHKDMENPIQYLSFIMRLTPNLFINNDFTNILDLHYRRDAESSVYQIISALTSDIPLATSTNVLNTENKSKGLSFDLYNIILNNLLSYLNTLSYEQYLIDYGKTRPEVLPEGLINSITLGETTIEDINLDTKQTTIFKEDINLDTKQTTIFKSESAFKEAIRHASSFLTRDLVKKIAMPYPYGITPFTVSQHIHRDFIAYYPGYNRKLLQPLSKLI